MRRQSRGWHKALTASIKALGNEPRKCNIAVRFRRSDGGNRVCDALSARVTRAAGVAGQRKDTGGCLGTWEPERSGDSQPLFLNNAGNPLGLCCHKTGTGRHRITTFRRAAGALIRSASETNRAAAVSRDEAAKGEAATDRRSRSAFIVASERWRTETEGKPPAKFYQPMLATEAPGTGGPAARKHDRDSRHGQRVNETAADSVSRVRGHAQWTLQRRGCGKSARPDL